MSPRQRTAVALTLTFLTAGLGTALLARQAPPDSLRKGIVVPFKMLPSNHMVIRAKINDKGPFDLIFDLGSPLTLLSNRAGEKSGVIKKGAPRSFLFGMRGEAEADKLQVGDLTTEKLPVLVMDHPVLNALGSIFGRPIDGLIGYTFFARYRTTIDYKAGEMTFEPVDFKVGNLIKDLPDRLMAPKVARRTVLAPGGLWGLTVGKPAAGPGSAGVPIAAIVPGSPAEAAGLKPGDTLTTLDGRWTTTIADAYAAAAGVAPGQAATVVILRDGKEMTLKVTPREGI